MIDELKLNTLLLQDGPFQAINSEKKINTWRMTVS